MKCIVIFSWELICESWCVVRLLVFHRKLNQFYPGITREKNIHFWQDDVIDSHTMSNFYQWLSDSKRLDKQIFQWLHSLCITLWLNDRRQNYLFVSLYNSVHLHTHARRFSLFSNVASWPGVVGVSLCQFFLQQSNMAMKNPPFLDVFTHIYRMYIISMYFLLDSKLFWRLDESIMPFFHPINCHRISPFNEKVRIPMPSKILNFFKICPALVLLPRPSTSSHPKCGYLHGVWEIPQKRCCLIKWNHKIFDKDPQLQGIFVGGWQM